MADLTVAQVIAALMVGIDHLATCGRCATGYLSDCAGGKAACMARDAARDLIAALPSPDGGALEQRRRDFAAGMNLQRRVHCGYPQNGRVEVCVNGQWVLPEDACTAYLAQPETDALARPAIGGVVTGEQEEPRILTQQPPTTVPAPQCTGPFSDARDCPVHDPRLRVAAVPAPDGGARQVLEELIAEFDTERHVGWSWHKDRVEVKLAALPLPALPLPASPAPLAEMPVIEIEIGDRVAVHGGVHVVGADDVRYWNYWNVTMACVAEIIKPDGGTWTRPAQDA